MATSALFLAVVGWLASASIAVAQDDTEVCGAGLRAAAELNAVSLARMAWAPFGRPETGWAIYEPMVAGEVSTACAAICLSSSRTPAYVFARSAPALAAAALAWARLAIKSGTSSLATTAPFAIAAPGSAEISPSLPLIRGEIRISVRRTMPMIGCGSRSARFDW